MRWPLKVLSPGVKEKSVASMRGALVGRAEGEGVGSEDLDGLGLELEGGRILGESAAGEDVDVAGDVGSECPVKTGMLVVPKGRLAPRVWRFCRPGEDGHLGAGEAAGGGEEGAGKGIGEDLGVGKGDALVAEVIGGEEAERGGEGALEVVLVVEVAGAELVAAGDAVVDLDEVLSAVDVGVGLGDVGAGDGVVAGVAVKGGDEGVGYGFR